MSVMRDPALVAFLRSAARRFSVPFAVFALVLAVGTFGYLRIGGPQTSWLDALYMTYITIATIGYHEVVDLSHSPGGQVFTMGIAAAGILNFSYLVSVMTAFLIEADLNEAIRRRRMQNVIERLSQHYIIGGIGRVGENVANELLATGRPHVVIDVDPAKVQAHRERHPEALCLVGDASEDELLLRAGLERASGVFAITGDDSKNLVIALSAKQLNPAVRVVARCHEVSFVEKIRRVGADDIVSPDFTGGMRIASSMIRPHVVSFLDEMLRADKALRVEEVKIPAGFAGSLGSLHIGGPDYVLLALKEEGGGPGEWLFNPQPAQRVMAGSTLVVMTTPSGRTALEARLAEAVVRAA